jgi:hypothetical protein
MTREEEIAAALTAVEPQAPKWLHRGFTAAEAKSFEQRIDKIVGLLDRHQSGASSAGRTSGGAWAICCR